MKAIQGLVVVLIISGLGLFIGCSAIQDAITPTYVDKAAAEWSQQPTTMFLPYTTLWDAKRIVAAMDFRFATEKIRYGYYSGIMSLSIAGGEELKQTLFSPTGPIGLLATTVGGGTLGALLIERPGDKSKKEIAKENS